LIEAYIKELGLIKANFNAARSTRSALITISENLANLCPPSNTPTPTNSAKINDTSSITTSSSSSSSSKDTIEDLEGESYQEHLLTMLLDLPTPNTSSHKHKNRAFSNGASNNNGMMNRPGANQLKSSFNNGFPGLGGGDIDSPTAATSPSSSSSSSNNSIISSLMNNPNGVKSPLDLLNEAGSMLLPSLEVFMNHLDGSFNCLEEMLSHGEWRCEEDGRRLSVKKDELEESLEVCICIYMFISIHI
jgi:hypothetical protein